MLLLIALLRVTLLLPSVSAEDQFDLKPYLDKCGGRIYSSCDSPELNQVHIFNSAREMALKKKNRLFVVFGADWCPSCQKFHNLLTNDPDKSQFQEFFTVVSIHDTAASAREIKDLLNISFMGIPRAFVVDPNTNSVSHQLYPSAFKTLANLLDSITPGSKTAVANEPVDIKPTQLWQVDVRTIEKPIEIVESYGSSSFIPNPQTLAEKFINQGVAALHLYHYVDAFRSFREAERLDSRLAMAYVGQVIAVCEIDADQGDFFARGALRRAKASALKGSWTAADLAWLEFAKSYRAGALEVFVATPDESIMSLDKAYEDLLTADKHNLDGLSLATWLVYSGTGYPEAKVKFESILKELPNNIGTHHALLHIAERRNESERARFHASALVRLAPNSAHAQHMYGHTLPQQGKWAEALAHFQKANNIHRSWAQKNRLEVDQDWHYWHNVELMAAAFLGLGDVGNAQALYFMGRHNYRFMLYWLRLSVANDEYKTADRRLRAIESQTDYQGDKSLAVLRAELNLTKQSTSEYAKKIAALGDKSAFSNLLVRLTTKPVLGAVDKDLSNDISSYFTSEFTKGGFEGWSGAYVQLLRLSRVARILGESDLLADIAALQFSVRSGQLCNSLGREEYSLIKCIP